MLKAWLSPFLYEEGGTQERKIISCHCPGIQRQRRSSYTTHAFPPNALGTNYSSQSTVLCGVYLPPNHGHFHLCAGMSKSNTKSFRALPWFHSQRRWFCCKISKFSLQIAHQLFLVRRWKNKINNIPISPPKKETNKTQYAIWISLHSSGYSEQEQTRPARQHCSPAWHRGAAGLAVGWRCNSAIQCLPSVHEALGWNLSTANKQKSTNNQVKEVRFIKTSTTHSVLYTDTRL